MYKINDIVVLKDNSIVKITNIVAKVSCSGVGKIVYDGTYLNNLNGKVFNVSIRRLATEKDRLKLLAEVL